MSFMNDKDRETVKKKLENMANPVKLLFFTQETECMYCKETKELLIELAELSEKITLQVFDFVKNKDEAEKYHIDKIPATVVMSEEDYGIRFYGIPTGYEFASLLHCVDIVSSGQSGLHADTKEFLSKLEKEIHLQVFVTPTCPYCPGSVVLAHQMALESAKVRADMVEITEFPHLAQKYHVMGVPHTVINGEHYLEGRAPESMLLDKIKQALK